ncbi:polysaccharide deacetylase family protein (PEP-CTERM system associated) [Aquimarina sp. EL_43]|uniref:polysaccharide deacetylase family protein n=1 Tax=unclassified Aquimarina TaxID=2627091 RepID=UPI0018CBB93E|nr:MULTISPECIES: polysaccharide deacetylase family protein [unclassified Aquimarina]MBG6131693.1 polysaccharide deacetylase family protein (PEP-CTERM system associated) [Aquimarina sp. EL_35]MBG6152154.1 polysaccharide deacetylase family protein (PEP-CTERM system associated) [Aquimarina sp. EL_32]MBG6169902.1 polysaccharide deacetylase family protein (PEP-CTERM system associated) [Aquimarina sp. EL_43]
MSIILTFDIEEWFHVLDNKSTKTQKEWGNFENRIHENMDRILKILSDNNLKATFFCLGWIAKKYPSIIKQIDDLGYEIGTHSHMHQLAYEMNKNEFREDLKKSIDLLQSITGKKIESYRAPGFSITSKNLWAFEILHEEGIKNDCSIFPANRAHGGVPHFSSKEPCIIKYDGVSLKEFPINVSNILGKKMIFSGGGYFRLMPYWLVKKMTDRADYVMTYFHPRDFDYNQPMIEELNYIRKFKSYYGLKDCEPKLRKWINDYKFVDLKTYSDDINWEEKDVVVLK